MTSYCTALWQMIRITKIMLSWWRWSSCGWCWWWCWRRCWGWCWSSCVAPSLRVHLGASSPWVTLASIPMSMHKRIIKQAHHHKSTSSHKHIISQAHHPHQQQHHHISIGISNSNNTSPSSHQQSLIDSIQILKYRRNYAEYDLKEVPPKMLLVKGRSKISLSRYDQSILRKYLGETFVVANWHNYQLP